MRSDCMHQTLGAAKADVGNDDVYWRLDYVDGRSCVFTTQDAAAFALSSNEGAVCIVKVSTTGRFIRAGRVTGRVYASGKRVFSWYVCIDGIVQASPKRTGTYKQACDKCRADVRRVRAELKGK